MLLVIGYATALIAILLFRLRTLPSVSLILFAIVPTSAVTDGAVLLAISPPVLVLLGWTIRARLSREVPPYAMRPRWGLTGWIWAASVTLVIVSSFVSGTLDSNPWLLAFLAAFFLIPLLGFGVVEQGFAQIGPTWSWLTIALGAYAVVERSIATNPLYGEIFSSGPQALTQKWSVYRATVSIGHPLFVSTFLAVGVAISLGLLIESFRWRWLAATLMGAVGVIATGSRSGLICLAVAGTVILIVGLARRFDRTLRSIVVVAPATIIVASIGFSYVLERLVSDEAQSSSDYRDLLFSVGTRIAASAPFSGLGAPGLASAAIDAGLPTGGNFENSWIELTIAFGFLTSICLVLTLLAFAFRALQLRHLGAVGAISAFLVAAVSFNLVFGHPSSLYLLSVLMLYCVSRGATIQAKMAFNPRLSRPALA